MDLDKTLQKINATFGANSIRRMSDVDNTVEVISTGSLSIDLATGVQGFPRGRIIEIFGPESSGKTTLAIHAMAEAQKLGEEVCVIDAEHSFDKYYASQCGVDVDSLLITQPDNGEMGMEILTKLLETKQIGMIVIDSVAALTPKAEIDGEVGDSKMGLHARLMSQTMRKVTGLISKSNCVVIFINQLREKIGIVFGNPEVTTGGNALKYYASVRIEIRRKSTTKDKDGNLIGITSSVKIAKNKVGPPYAKVLVPIGFGTGINLVQEVVKLGVELGVITKKGSWYSYEDAKIGQGEASVVEILEDNPELVQMIRDQIEEKYFEEDD